jgi:hypothetical protein
MLFLMLKDKEDKDSKGVARRSNREEIAMSMSAPQLQKISLFCQIGNINILQHCHLDIGRNFMKKIYSLQSLNS